MKDISTITYHSASEKLVQILCQKTQSTNALFFRVIVAYYFSKLASMMRTNIETHDRGTIPVNLYAINLALSGTGKGHSTNIIEEQILKKFKSRFLEETFPEVSKVHIAKLAVKRAARKKIDPDKELPKTQKEFNDLGNLAFSFDSGTTAAVKQMRHKLLMADAGSINMEIDEIGSNLLGNMDVLNTFLELFDVGNIKQKLVKNTNENIRNEEIDGKTPTNMMLYGTPDKLLNGGKAEDEFYSFLETGYARRCLFGYTTAANKDSTRTAEEVYKMLTNANTTTYVSELADKLEALADVSNFNKTITMSKDTAIEIIEYRLHCEDMSDKLPTHQGIRKAELSHRYFKALKLAGTYAFIDNSPTLTSDHFYNAVKLVEESGASFENLLTRERNYVKLARYIANVEHEVTHVDLVEDLPFYKGTLAQKQELMNLAIAFGYKNHIVIKRAFNDGIEFISGESLKETDINDLTLTYSNHYAENYVIDKNPVRFDKLHQLCTLKNMHWVNHYLKDGYRLEENVLPGFDMLVLDVDKDVKWDVAKTLLKDFKYFTHTSKSHTEENNRFRIILPMKYSLKLTADEFKEFMANVFEWLPFPADEQTNQRSRKWQTYSQCKYYYNDGALFDPVSFIPKTTKNDERKKGLQDLRSLSNLERWFVNNTGSGNRNNQLLKYALILVDSGLSFEVVAENVSTLNEKLADKIDPDELHNTIMVTVAKRMKSSE